jgi:hypothetical protein
MKITKTQLQNLIKEAITEQANPSELKSLQKEMNNSISQAVKFMDAWEKSAAKALNVLEDNGLVSDEEQEKILGFIEKMAFNVSESHEKHVLMYLMMEKFIAASERRKKLQDRDGYVELPEANDSLAKSSSMSLPKVRMPSKNKFQLAFNDLLQDKSAFEYEVHDTTRRPIERAAADYAFKTQKKGFSPDPVRFILSEDVDSLYSYVKTLASAPDLSSVGDNIYHDLSTLFNDFERERNIDADQLPVFARLLAADILMIMGFKA